MQQALTRLSTGLRINSGKDDPAGLIASESLRADITSIDKAISNSTRANLLIGTADSALGQVSSLLNDIRGLVVEAANVGTLSTEQIEANQLQVDSSLEAINRIAQTTTFQGRRLLDGSLAFNTTINTVPSVTRRADRPGEPGFGRSDRRGSPDLGRRDGGRNHEYRRVHRRRERHGRHHLVVRRVDSRTPRPVRSCTSML